MLNGNRYISCVVAAVLGMFIFPNRVLSQDPSMPIQQFDLPRFYFDALSFATQQQDTSRLDVYIELPYELLSFTKDGDVFRANLEVTMDISDSLGNLLNEQLWTEKIEAKNYDESVSGHLGKLCQKSFLLSPGVYKTAVQVRDAETKNSRHINRTVIVRKFAPGALRISDLLLVNRLERRPERTVVVPNISGNIGTKRDSFYIFFEAYRSGIAESAKFLLTVHTVKGEIVQRDSLLRSLGNGGNACFMKVDCSKLSAGGYIAEVQGWSVDTSSGLVIRPGTAIASHMFTIRWKGLPPTVTDLDLAIDELQYIADKDVIQAMKQETPEKRRQMFLDFWKKRDPTPNTETNELMEEYYQRVDYANKTFSHYADGWKTDRGMVYIIFGVPSNVERHPFDMDSKPYEVWTYYEHNRQFVFVDATGFGDYRLQNPIWDTWRTGYR
jgi:GWxTD domain-containing protein